MIEEVDSNSLELYAALRAAGLPIDDLAEEGRRFFRFSEGGHSLGFGGYELYDTKVLLRSIVILPNARGRGQGKAVTSLLLDHARREGAREAYLLTTDAASFFQALGFQIIDRESAPASILATRQAAALCPATATLMMLSMPREPMTDEVHNGLSGGIARQPEPLHHD
jgi:N-acetylglutamate synthase-like GNAT family acetyltransferase